MKKKALFTILFATLALYGCPGDGDDGTGGEGGSAGTGGTGGGTGGTGGGTGGTGGGTGGSGGGTGGTGGTAAEVVYEQDFELLDQMGATALGDDGWLVFGNVFAPPDTMPKISYGPFAAPNGGAAFSAIVTGQGGVDQGAQQLSIYSDYNCCDLGLPTEQGHGGPGTDLVESNVFQEINPIPAEFVGKTLTFSFDAKSGNINDPADGECAAPNVCDSTALAFIKTLDPNAGFMQTNFITEDTTNLPDTWGSFTLSLVIDAGLEGQILQVGFASTANSFEPSGIIYDNLSAQLVTP